MQRTVPRRFYVRNALYGHLWPWLGLWWMHCNATRWRMPCEQNRIMAARFTNGDVIEFRRPTKPLHCHTHSLASHDTNAWRVRTLEERYSPCDNVLCTKILRNWMSSWLMECTLHTDWMLMFFGRTISFITLHILYGYCISLSMRIKKVIFVMTEFTSKDLWADIARCDLLVRVFLQIVIFAVDEHTTSIVRCITASTNAHKKKTKTKT